MIAPPKIINVSKKTHSLKIKLLNLKLIIRKKTKINKGVTIKSESDNRKKSNT
jgi:hypothetical protein